MEMSKYIKITNHLGPDGKVSRLALEKLGLSTKRNDSETIGQFGSGIKFAPIAALRNGWEWWFTGRDDRGEYFLQYVVREEDGIDCIWYDYGDDLKPSSFTLGAGELSWTEPFQVLREPIANAMDGAKELDSSWEYTFVDEVDYCDGEFSVYITAAPELVNILDNYSSYFSDKTERIFTSTNRHLLKKNGSGVGIYCHDVLVHTSDEESLFDYNLNLLSLNEERTVKNQYELNSQIVQTIGAVDSSIAKTIIREAIRGNKYEWSAGIVSSYKYVTFAADWCEIFKEMYGENAVLVENDNYVDAVSRALEYRDKNPVVVRSEFGIALLEAADIPTAINYIGEQANFDIDYDIEKYPSLMSAISIARLAEPKLNEYLEDLGVLMGDAARDVRGMTLNMNNGNPRKIVVSENHLQNGSVSDIVATLLHECDHATSGIGDGFSDEGRAFRNIADERIGRMIMENYKPNPFFVKDGMVSFRVSDMSLIGGGIVAITEHVRMLDCFLMKIGNYVIKLFGHQIEENFGHEHQPNFSDDATIVTYPTFINVEKIEIVS